MEMRIAKSVPLLFPDVGLIACFSTVDEGPEGFQA